MHFYESTRLEYNKKYNISTVYFYIKKYSFRYGSNFSEIVPYLKPYFDILKYVLQNTAVLLR